MNKGIYFSFSFTHETDKRISTGKRLILLIQPTCWPPLEDSSNSDNDPSRIPAYGCLKAAFYLYNKKRRKISPCMPEILHGKDTFRGKEHTLSNPPHPTCSYFGVNTDHISWDRIINSVHGNQYNVNIICEAPFLWTWTPAFK